MTKIRTRQVHLDFHTSEHIPNIGIDFNKEEFAQTLEKAKVNSITCFARCHHGWCYYPSKAFPETIHPNLTNKNLLIDQIDACHIKGIDVPIYTTVQWDAYIARTHPEWLAVDADGNYINSQGIPEPHFYYTICLNSPYRDYFKEHLIDLIEVVGPDKIDGIFMDILFRTDCNCQHCQKEMEKKGIANDSTINRLAYSEIMLTEFKAEISALINKHAPKAGIFYNGSHVGYADKRNLDAYSHLELESLPSGGWGYDHFPITARYSRNLNKQFIGMTGKFHTYWGDFHSLKNKEALEFEVLNMFALGAHGSSIGDQLHPDGKLSDAAYDLIGHVYNIVEKIEDDCLSANIPVTEIGVLTPEESWVAGGHSLRTDPSLIGINRMLQELNYQFDIIDSEMDFNKYKVIILPDVIQYKATLYEKLVAFEKSGGTVISSYKSLFDNETYYKNDLFGIEYLGEADYDRDFILPNETIGKNLPKEEFVMYLKGAKVDSIGAKTVVDSVQTFFNRENGKFCSHQHAPSTKTIGRPAVTQNNNVYYFSHPVFRIYRKNAPRWIKEMVKDILEMSIDQKYLNHNGPNTLLSTVNRSEDGNKHLIHLLHYIMQKNSEDIYTIDGVIPLHNLEIDYLVNDKTVKTVREIHSGQSLEFKQDDGIVTVFVDKLDGHALIEVITE